MARARPPSPAEALIPPDPDLDALRSAAAGCRACDLWERGTQTVFGEGEPGAELVLVGEQPGDKEDLEGAPFVGPAGRVLDAGLEAAGIDRRLAYVTNVVKHFKWEPRGKVRLHKTPNAAEVHACRPWLEAELRTLRPSVLVCLGATAAKALLGPSFKVSEQRGRFVDSDLAPSVLATVHPSSILRTDGPDRDAAMDAFVADLRVAATAFRR
jgi:uracil-DNA glycosylase family protein